MASNDNNAVPDEYSASSVDRPMNRMSDQNLLTPSRVLRGNMSTTSSSNPISPEDIQMPLNAQGQPPHQGPPLDRIQGGVGGAPAPGRSRGKTRSPRPTSRARTTGDEQLALRRRGQNAVAENPQRSTLTPSITWPSQQIGNPTGVMPVGLSCWQSGLNPAVPFPTCAAGVIPTGQGNIVQQALELARRTQENLKAGAPIQFVQQNVQLNIQHQHQDEHSVEVQRPPFMRNGVSNRHEMTELSPKLT